MKTKTLDCCALINSRQSNLFFLATAIIVMLLSCAHSEKVLVPPKVDLKTYPSIGVVEFSTNAEDSLKPYVTQNFIENIQSAQPGTRILELGDAEVLMRSLGHSQLNAETIQSIGQKYKVDAIILGHLQVSQLKPKINITTAAKSLNAKAYIEAALKTRILETDSGATCWTRATSGKTQVAAINLIKDGPFSVGVSDPKEKYGQLVPKLVYTNTMDFRSHYAYRTVK
ncbi:MAG: hypothetical protein R3274_05725 [Desulfobacterales bacterium]|nr:hypothetical protein [Desulfobacterales bacterium]